MDQTLRDKGLANRKEVLGEEYVNKSMAAADSFNGPFQEILNEYCWGLIWSDERLPKKTRSMLNLVMLACLNRMHEWELHLKGALRNGVSKDEIQAIIHQIAIYAAKCSPTLRRARDLGVGPLSDLRDQSQSVEAVGSGPCVASLSSQIRHPMPGSSGWTRLGAAGRMATSSERCRS